MSQLEDDEQWFERVVQMTVRRFCDPHVLCLRSPVDNAWEPNSLNRVVERVLRRLGIDEIAAFTKLRLAAAKRITGLAVIEIARIDQARRWNDSEQRVRCGQPVNA